MEVEELAVAVGGWGGFVGGEAEAGEFAAEGAEDVLSGFDADSEVRGAGVRSGWWR